ncbi:MAG: hypothetical protein HY658_06770 [Actinobacteria bacterium]|nr:hypothetical protein [Actinomycetota bacterium]
MTDRHRPTLARTFSALAIALLLTATACSSAGPGGGTTAPPTSPDGPTTGTGNGETTEPPTTEPPESPLAGWGGLGAIADGLGLSFEQKAMLAGVVQQDELDDLYDPTGGAGLPAQAGLDIEQFAAFTLELSRPDVNRLFNRSVFECVDSYGALVGGAAGQIHQALCNGNIPPGRTLFVCEEVAGPLLKPPTDRAYQFGFAYPHPDRGRFHADQRPRDIYQDASGAVSAFIGADYADVQHLAFDKEVGFLFPTEDPARFLSVQRERRGTACRVAPVEALGESYTYPVRAFLACFSDGRAIADSFPDEGFTDQVVDLGAPGA